MNARDNARALRASWLAHLSVCDDCQSGAMDLPSRFCAVGGPLFEQLEAAVMALPLIGRAAVLKNGPPPDDVDQE